MEVTAKTSRRLILAATIASLFATVATPALADVETLVDKLHDKGVLSDEEYQEMRTEARAERRAQALKEANEQEKSAKKAESAPSELTGRFKDGFTWESGDKENSISLIGRIHADYRRFNVDSGSVTGANANSANTFDVRRAYLGVTGKLYNDWTWELTTDLAADTIEYAWINYKFNDTVQARIGAFKMPFSYEELTSSRLIDFQERSLANGLVPGKEQGLSIYGSPMKWMSYALAVSNGNGKEGDETNAVVDGHDIIGRLAFNFADLAQISNTVLHLGVARAQGTIPVGAPTGTIRTEGRGLQFFNASAFTGLNGAGLQELDRERTGFEAIAAWGPLKLQAEAIKANFSGTSNGGVAYDRDIDASYVELMWLITGEKYADFYSLNGSRPIKPNRAFKKGADGWGAWELGARLSEFDAGDFTTTNPAGTGVLAATCNGTGACTNKAKAVTIGLKWIPTTNTRVYLNYTKTKFDTQVGGVVKDNANGTTDNEKAITLRTAIFW